MLLSCVCPFVTEKIKNFLSMLLSRVCPFVCLFVCGHYFGGRPWSQFCFNCHDIWSKVAPFSSHVLINFWLTLTLTQGHSKVKCVKLRKIKIPYNFLNIGCRKTQLVPNCRKFYALTDYGLKLRLIISN